MPFAMSRRSETMNTDPSSDYKNHARRLRDALAADGISVTHAKALELVARQNGARDWNTLSGACPRHDRLGGVRRFALAKPLPARSTAARRMAASSACRKRSSRTCGG
jgi:hypothetical protein